MTQSETSIAEGLSEAQVAIVMHRGFAYGGTHFAAKLMNPLVKRGLFDRIDRKGWSPKFPITETGLRIRSYLISKGS